LILDNACEFKAETSSSKFWTPLTCEDAGRIKSPTLLLTGERSLKMLKMVVEELDRCLTNNELVTVPSSSHETASENPEAYNKIVLDFLAKHAK
jgi:pimeloyl-ACP methyl ester carboxylesterase